VTPDRRRSDELHARIAMSRLAEPGDRRLGELIDTHGAMAVEALIRSANPPEGFPDRRHWHIDVDHDLRAAQRCGAQPVIPTDLTWPKALNDLGPAMPLLLWVRGRPELVSLAGTRGVSVVGARAASPYGEQVAASLAADLADRAWVVVSGAAYGIDGAAHRGALTVEGNTVAVLACGIDHCYPRGHQELVSNIAVRGAVITELPPGSEPWRSRFLERNRLIAALTRGTVVVEAGIRSGASHTARRAAQLARSVMAVPGPVTSATSLGCHELIRCEGACLVNDVHDVLDIVGELGIDARPRRRSGDPGITAISAAGLVVLQAIPAYDAAGPARLAELSGLTVDQVMRELQTLSSHGLVWRSGTGWCLTPAGRRRHGQC
jgi:DNA processing protein